MSSTPSTPCRAQDPATCRYHGPEIKAAEAAARGEWDAVLTLLLERDANKDIRDAELIAFQQEFGLPSALTATQPDLYTMGVKKRIAYLEEQVLTKDLSFERHLSGYRKNDAQAVDVAIAMVAKYTPADTIYDIAKAESDYDDDFERFFRAPHANIAAEIVPLWQDTPALLRAPRNLLIPPIGGDWRRGFKHELAKALATRGKLMSRNASYYGWEDYDYVLTANRDKQTDYNQRPYEVAAVLHAAEDRWDEFEGTFTDSSSHVGVSGWGVLTDGSVHRLRLEEEFGSLLRDMTRD